MQVGKRIFAVNDFTFVGILAVFMYKLGSQSRAAQNYRDGDSFLVEYFQIFFHECGGFYQQATHGNTVGFVLFVGFDDIVN